MYHEEELFLVIEISFMLNLNGADVSELNVISSLKCEYLLKKPIVGLVTAEEIAKHVQLMYV